jgi:hypothetical protein
VPTSSSASLTRRSLTAIGKGWLRRKSRASLDPAQDPTFLNFGSGFWVFGVYIFLALKIFLGQTFFFGLPILCSDLE